MPVMQPANRTSTADRSRAVRRLRHLTIGTTVASLSASVVFAGLAAATYTGAASDAETTPTTATTTSTTADADVALTADSTTTATSSTDSSATTSNTSSSSAAVGSTLGSGHVARGG